MSSDWVKAVNKQMRRMRARSDRDALDQGFNLIMGKAAEAGEEGTAAAPASEPGATGDMQIHWTNMVSIINGCGCMLGYRTFTKPEYDDICSSPIQQPNDMDSGPALYVYANQDGIVQIPAALVADVPAVVDRLVEAMTLARARNMLVNEAVQLAKCSENKADHGSSEGEHSDGDASSYSAATLATLKAIHARIIALKSAESVPPPELDTPNKLQQALATQKGWGRAPEDFKTAKLRPIEDLYSELTDKQIAAAFKETLLDRQDCCLCPSHDIRLVPVKPKSREAGLHCQYKVEYGEPYC